MLLLKLVPSISEVSLVRFFSKKEQNEIEKGKKTKKSRKKQAKREK